MLCPSSDFFLKLFQAFLHNWMATASAWVHGRSVPSHTCSNKKLLNSASSPGNGFKLKDGQSRLPEKEVFYSEGGEDLAQLAHRSCGCPTFGSIQGEVGWGLELPGLLEGVPAHGRGVELDELQGPFQPKAVCEFMIFLWLLVPDCSHLDAGDIPSGALFHGIQRETSRSTSGHFVLGARGDGSLAHCGFGEVVGRVGTYSSHSGCVALGIVHSCCRLLFVVSNSPFSLLPCPTRVEPCKYCYLYIL